MKTDEGRPRDWQEEVWRVKEELAAEAKRMGMREYLVFVEREAERILEARAKPTAFAAHDKNQAEVLDEPPIAHDLPAQQHADRPPTNQQRPRSRKR
jgi:hypothetical protein